jgi:hypothetical protein
VSSPCLAQWQGEPSDEPWPVLDPSEVGLPEPERAVEAKRRQNNSEEDESDGGRLSIPLSVSGTVAAGMGLGALYFAGAFALCDLLSGVALEEDGDPGECATRSTVARVLLGTGTALLGSGGIMIGIGAAPAPEQQAQIVVTPAGAALRWTF